MIEIVETVDLLVRTWKTYYKLASMESSASNNILQRFKQSPLKVNSREGADLYNLSQHYLCWNIP
jgi:hypothetical protein